MRTRLPQHAWVGESGEQYAYVVREWPARLATVPGNFILARAEANGEWKPIFIGTCDDLEEIARSKLAR